MHKACKHTPVFFHPMTHFCNAQRPDFMSGIPEIAQKLNASLIKQSKNKSNSWPQKINESKMLHLAGKKYNK